MPFLLLVCQWCVEFCAVFLSCDREANPVYARRIFAHRIKLDDQCQTSFGRSDVRTVSKRLSDFRPLKARLHESDARIKSPILQHLRFSVALDRPQRSFVFEISPRHRQSLSVLSGTECVADAGAFSWSASGQGDVAGGAGAARRRTRAKRPHQHCVRWLYWHRDD